MKEFRLDDMLPLEALKSRIWMMFDILRNERISSNDYHVILYLLSCYKDGFISYDLSYEKLQLKDKLAEHLHNSSHELFKQYEPIHGSFEPLIKLLSESGTKQLLGALWTLNRQVLTENFAEIFDSVLYRISQSLGKEGADVIQPIELTRLMGGLCDLKPDAKVFNPFAGLASFGVFFDQAQYYTGQELDRRTWALGALRLMAYRRPGNSEYVNSDSILNWPDSSEKFDLVISSPPLEVRLGKQYGNVANKAQTLDHFLIRKSIDILKHGGKAILLLSRSILYRESQDKILREYLIEEDLIETIISLPGGLLLTTGIPQVILVLSKSKKTPGQVKFIDAQRFVVNKGPREKQLNDYQLSSFLDKNIIDDSVRVISNVQIRANNYTLHIARYFQKRVEGVKLGELLELIRGNRNSLPDVGKFVRIRDLKDDKIDFTLDASGVEDTLLIRPDIQSINESCLLLAMRWRSIKPTYFDYHNEPIFKSHDIQAFRINESRVDKAYLVNEFHSDYVHEQVESYRLGVSGMPYIRVDDLMEVVVKLPTIEEQRAKVQGIYELSDKLKSLQEERNALAHGKTLNQFSEFASLKHTLGRPRQNILDWSDNLLDFLTKKKEGFEALNKAFSEFYDIDIISALKEIKRDVNFITDVLEKGENGLVLTEYEKYVIPLSDINSIINELSSNGFNFKVKKLLLKGEKLKERGIYANKTLFKTLLDNILTNANKYAFDKKATGNEVVIELTEVDDLLSMEIRNNGKPFPKNFDREKFITKYSTADSTNGSGLGGYDIHRIASDFNNPDWILSLNEDPFFLVKFKFQFPIKLIN